MWSLRERDSRRSDAWPPHSQPGTIFRPKHKELKSKQRTMVSLGWEVEIRIWDCWRRCCLQGNGLKRFILTRCLFSKNLYIQCNSNQNSNWLFKNWQIDSKCCMKSNDLENSAILKKKKEVTSKLEDLTYLTSKFITGLQ